MLGSCAWFWLFSLYIPRKPLFRLSRSPTDCGRPQTIVAPAFKCIFSPGSFLSPSRFWRR